MNNLEQMARTARKAEEVPMVEEVPDLPSNVGPTVDEFTGKISDYIKTGYHKRADQLSKSFRKVFSDFEKDARENMGYNEDQGLKPEHKADLADRVLIEMAKQSVHKNAAHKDHAVYQRDEEGNIATDEDGEKQYNMEYLKSASFLSKFRHRSYRDFRQSINGIGQLDTRSTDGLANNYSGLQAQSELQHVMQQVDNFQEREEGGDFYKVKEHAKTLAGELGVKRVRRMDTSEDIQAVYQAALGKAAQEYSDRNAVQ